MHSILLYIILFSSILSAQTGSIRGTISDSDSDKEMIGVNIVVMGSYKGAATDIDGLYHITHLQSGTWDLQISNLGYKTVLVTGVPVIDGQTTRRDISMEKAYIAGEDVIIVGKKPLMEVDNTSSVARID